MVWWAIVLLAVFLIGVTKSGFGAGVGLMVVPMTAISLDHIPGHHSQDALGLLLPLLISGDLLAVWQYVRVMFPAAAPAKHPPLVLAAKTEGTPDLPGAMLPSPSPCTQGEGRGEGEWNSAGQVHTQNDPYPNPPPGYRDRGQEKNDNAPHLQARAVLWRLMPGTAVGVIIGGTLLAALHYRADLVGALIRIEIGIESILLVALHWWRMWRGVQQRLLREPWRSNLTGAFSAVSSTMAHAAGPIVAMYLLPLRLNRQLFVATCAFYFFILNTAKIAAYYPTGQFAHAHLSYTLRFLPLVLAGALFGKWLNRRMSDLLFTTIVYMVTFALGWYILSDGILRLFFHTHIA